MNPDIVDLQWVAQCAHRLRDQWPHADPVTIDEAALELWRDASLRTLPAVDAAEAWLTPLITTF